MAGEFRFYVCNDDMLRGGSATAEIELRLANIIAAVRDVAIAAEERLREIAQAGPGSPAVLHGGLGCAPHVIEASRVQISALQAMLSQVQRLAA